MARDSKHPVVNAPAGDLAQLVAMEHDLEARLAGARQEAGDLLDAARRAAAQDLETFDIELAGLRGARRDRLEVERKQSADRLLAEGDRQAAWYDDLPEARETELAAFLVKRLLDEGAP